MYKNQAESTDINKFLFNSKFALVVLYEISCSHKLLIDWWTALFTFKS